VGWRDARVLLGRGIGERISYGNSPAIVVVDMTRAFTDPSYRVGSDQPDTVEAIAQVLAAARERGDVPVFFTTMPTKPMGSKYGDVVSVAEVLEYLPKDSVEEAAE
jgi:maleamate amidohydrolase